MSETKTTASPKNPAKSDRVRLGGAWKRTNEHGTYLSGLIEIDGKNRSIVISKAKIKNTDRSPDYNIFELADVTAKPAPKEVKPVVVEDEDDGIL